MTNKLELPHTANSVAPSRDTTSALIVLSAFSNINPAASGILLLMSTLVSVHTVGGRLSPTRPWRRGLSSGGRSGVASVGRGWVPTVTGRCDTPLEVFGVGFGA